MSRHHLLRRLHRSLVPLAAVPLLLTSLSGSLYGALSARDIEAFWLMKLHIGNLVCCWGVGVEISQQRRLLDQVARYRRSSEELRITDSELRAMAAPAIIGFSQPRAAIGIPIAL